MIAARNRSAVINDFGKQLLVEISDCMNDTGVDIT